MPATAVQRAPAPTARRQVSPGVVLGVILTVQLMVVIDAVIVNVALPDIARSLGFSATSLSWVVTAYTLTFGGLLLLGARTGDLLGRRRTFIAGIAVFTLASFVAGTSQSGSWLLAARAVQGLGGALAAPSALALLMTLFPEGRERIRALGWFSAVSIGGMAVGLTLGGMLTQWASWRWVFFVNVPIGIALIVAATLVLRETATRNGHFDLLGAAVSTAGITSFVYAFVSAAQNGWGAAVTIGSFVAGIVLLAAYVGVELRATEPITPMRLFTDRTRASSYIARLLLIAGVFGMFFFLTQFLQEVLGYSALVTGLGFVPFALMLFVMSQLSARRLVERFGGKRLMVGGLTVSTVGVLLLTQLSTTSSYLSVLIPTLLFGIGNGLAFVPLTAASLHNVRPGDAGAASGLVNVMQQLGGALGLAVLVSVFGSAGRTGITTLAAQSAFVTSADHAFAAAACFIGVTVVVVALFTPGRAAARAAAEVPQWVRSMQPGEPATPQR
ncbi:MAG: MFS transporter [Candidatus Dormibacteraeota bacterium]|nr:MFS transporter [Candidatus Dormibacteraeota bacterium]